MFIVKNLPHGDLLKAVKITHEKAVSTLPYKTTPRRGGMRGPVEHQRSHETSELLLEAPNLTGFISRSCAKTGRTHLTHKTGRRDYKSSHPEQKILKDFRI